MHWIGLKTLVTRECRVIVRFWRVTIAPPILATMMYFAIFGEIIRIRIGSVDGVTYSEYMAPGLVLLWAIPYSFGHTASGFVGARTYRYIEELRVSTMPGWIIAAGYVVGGAIRGLVVATSVGLTSLFFTTIAPWSIPLRVRCSSLVWYRQLAATSRRHLSEHSIKSP